MARIVLTCWGSYGDLFPYLAIAIRLKATGHEPMLAAPAYYGPRVAAEGIAFAPMHPDVDPADADLISRIMDPGRGTEVIVRELVVPAIQRAYDDLRPIVEQADLVVSHPVTFAARLAAETAGVPWISSVLAPTSMFSRYDFPLLPPFPAVLRIVRRRPWLADGFMALARRVTGPWTAPVRRLREQLGLPPAGDPLYEGQFSPRGTLALFSPIFGPPQPDWPPRTRATGFVFHTGTVDTLPDVVRAFLDDGPPPVVFTLGSSAVGAAGRFYEESVEAARALGRRALLLVGIDPRNQSPGALPAGMLAAAYAPHGAVFPRAAAVVHHGGIGTTAQVLRAGRPMLVVPHAHDQPDNAYRAERLGVARVLDARRYRATAATALLGALLAPRYARAAHDLGARIAAEDGVAAACDALVEAASGTPRGRAS